MNIGDLLGHWIGDSILPFFVTLITAALISQRNDYPRIKWLLFLIGGSILVVGIAIKLEWVFTVSIGGGLLVGWLLRSENRKNAAKDRNSAVATSALHKWFQSNRDQLSSEAYSPEFSAERAEQIVHQYADLLARGGRGWIPDASNLPYEKETIRGAIDARIEYLIAQKWRSRHATNAGIRTAHQLAWSNQVGVM